MTLLATDGMVRTASKPRSSMTSSRTGNSAVTVADRGHFSIRAISPKNDPAPMDATDARQLLAGGAVQTRYVYEDHREKLGRLIVDHTPNAVLGASLEDDSNVTGRMVAIYVVIGLLCTVLILATFLARVELARRARR